MKALVKKLKSCRYAKSYAPTLMLPSESHFNHRHHCDHEVMKIHWKLEKCGECGYYEPIAAEVKTAP